MVLEIKYNQSHELCYFKMEELSFDEVLKGAPFTTFLYSKDKTNASSMLLAINCNKVLAASDKFS